jgi:hypothetical protein
VLSGRGFCDELITRPEEFYRLCCVVVCDLETSRISAPYIQDDLEGICNNLGYDMCDSKKKSSYKHVSYFRRLRSYGHFLIPLHALM